MFLDRWGLTNVITLDGSNDASAEAEGYQAKLEAVPESILPRDADGFPVFDLALIGVGDDGHSRSFFVLCVKDIILEDSHLERLYTLDFNQSDRYIPIGTKFRNKQSGPLVLK